jgi:hypothetical protein
MRSPQTDRFFRRLAKELDEPAVIYLTGAMAGAIFGNVRSSADIDFAIEPRPKGKGRWDKIEEALRRTSRSTGISAQYARDIDRWGMISLLDYRKKAIPYRRFGRLDVRTLAPAHWAIGKITRYLETDVQDLVAVLKKMKVPAPALTRTLARAVRQSPPSSQRFQFRRHLEHFLQAYGRKVWGGGFDADSSIRAFHRLAGVSPQG